jgi:hypothetical protein
MQHITTKFPEHACQHCGSDRKLVETIVYDEFLWNEYKQEYQSNKFTDDFEHTGNEWCVRCEKEWTGE